MAAPVIWFGSWLWALMAFSGGAVAARSFRWGFWKIKRGPRGPMHTAEFEWPQPSPAVRLGTTTISSLVILLRIWQLGLPKGCAVISAEPQMSRETHLRA